MYSDSNWEIEESSSNFSQVHYDHLSGNTLLRSTNPSFPLRPDMLYIWKNYCYSLKINAICTRRKKEYINNSKYVSSLLDCRARVIITSGLIFERLGLFSLWFCHQRHTLPLSSVNWWWVSLCWWHRYSYLKYVWFRKKKINIYVPRITVPRIRTQNKHFHNRNYDLQLEWKRWWHMHWNHHKNSVCEINER